jgi:hypothetical protein
MKTEGSPSGVPARQATSLDVLCLMSAGGGPVARGADANLSDGSDGWPRYQKTPPDTSSVRNGFAHVNDFSGLWRYQFVLSCWGPVLARQRRFADQNEFAL